jgi:hypothetical protein
MNSWTLAGQTAAVTTLSGDTASLGFLDVPTSRRAQWLGPFLGKCAATSREICMRCVGCSPHPRWRFVVIDSYDISMLGWPAEHEKHQAAKEILDRENINEVRHLRAWGSACRAVPGMLRQKDTGFQVDRPALLTPQEKNSPDGMTGPQRRFVKFGGGMSDEQLDWLKASVAQQLPDALHAKEYVADQRRVKQAAHHLQAELAAAQDDAQRVVVFCHQPLHPDSCTGTTLAWTYVEVHSGPAHLWMNLLLPEPIACTTSAGSFAGYGHSPAGGQCGGSICRPHAHGAHTSWLCELPPPCFASLCCCSHKHVGFTCRMAMAGTRQASITEHSAPYWRRRLAATASDS